MKSRRRSLVILVFALAIAGLLIWKDVDQKQAVDAYNREQSELIGLGYPHGGHIDDPSDLALGISWLVGPRNRGDRRACADDRDEA
jgi:hypothetical protein